MAAGVRRLVNQNQTAPRAEDVDEGREGGRERTRLESEAAGSERGGQARRTTNLAERASTGNYALPPPHSLLDLPL
jgi:hypothetical protein